MLNALLVDDEPLSLRALSKLLEEEGFVGQALRDASLI